MAQTTISFHEFCTKVLKLDLRIGQRVIAKVAFGNMDPQDLPEDERKLAVEMFGGLEKVAPEHKRYVIMRLGRGSGKTTMCAAFAVYTCVTMDVSLAGVGDVPYVIIVAPDKETAKLSVRMAREMVRSTPSLERLVVSDKEQMIQLRRPDGRTVRIEAFAASKQGNNIRGRTIMAFIFDEAEFLTSNQEGSKDFAVNDEDIFRALKPRLLPAGKGMLISTPWPVETLMGKLFDQNWGRPINGLAIKAPTNLVRDEPHVLAMVEDEVAKDPENARREFYCELDGISGGEFFDINALALCLKEGMEHPGRREPLNPVAIGCDLGFTRDSSAIAVVEWTGKHYNTLYLAEYKPKPGKPLKPSDVMKSFAMVCKRFNAPGVVADSYYRESLKEQLAEAQLTVYDAPEGTKGKADVFQRTRAVLHEGLVCVPDCDIGRRLTQQARLVVAKASPGGATTIRIPRKIGMGHGDIVSAWTLAVHELAHKNVSQVRIAYEPGTPEWQSEWNRRAAVAMEKQQADYLKRITAEAKKSMGMAMYRRKFVAN